MSRAARNTLIGILGLILLVAPMLVRSSFFGNRGTYEPPQIDEHVNAVTPIPTVTALSQPLPLSAEPQELRAGPIVVDLAHFNFLDVTKFQPLSSALAQRGLGTRFWLPIGVDVMEITSFLDFPDQSEKLAEQLEDASGLIIVSPFFLWSQDEIEVVSEFVADGGRLLLISDPDIMGDLAQTMNLIAEPYGIVFNDDYLYNTERNDENFTFTFQGGYSDRATDLNGSEIVFYGARSIVGSIVEQVRSSETTLSSSRKGLTSFTTVAIGGLSSTETSERVLAMSDFDVLSEPYTERHDNALMLDFVADFMAGGGRLETLADFPGSLGKEVSLVYGTRDTVDADLIRVSAKLQQRLARSGRDMLLARSAPLSDGQIISSTQILTGPLAALVFDNLIESVDELLSNDDESANAIGMDIGSREGVVERERDQVAALVATSTLTPSVTPTEPAPEPLPSGNVIFLADFETAGDQDTLLSDAGFTLIHVARTPTPTPTEEPTPTATPTALEPTPTATFEVGTTDALTTTASISGTQGITSTRPISGTDSITESLENDENAELSGAPQVDSRTGSITQTGEITSVASFTETQLIAVDSDLITMTGSITTSLSITDTEPITQMEVPEPIITAYLVSNEGLQLLAAETVLVVQQTRSDDDKLIAVMGNSPPAINAGVERLLAGDFTDCVIEDEQAICPYVGSDSSKQSKSGSDSKNGASGSNGATDSDSVDAATPTPAPGENGGETEPDDASEDEPTAEPDEQPLAPNNAKIIIVDDNDNAADGETSEAELYMSVLNSLGASPAIWSVADSGTPPSDLLTGSDWVIWSSGSYAEGGPTVADLDPLFEVLNEGGRITISSQNTFFGQTQDPPSTLTDIQITRDVPALTAGLPDAPIELTSGAVSVAPIQANTDENPTLSVVIRRGPASDDTEEPILFTLVDDEVDEATGARLMVLGMSVEWLPPEVSSQLIENMMWWVLE